MEKRLRLVRRCPAHLAVFGRCKVLRHQWQENREHRRTKPARRLVGQPLVCSVGDKVSNQVVSVVYWCNCRRPQEVVYDPKTGTERA